MKKQIILLLIFILTAAVQNGLSKILVVCEYGLHNYPQIGQYVDDVTNIDHKTVERVYYLGVLGDNVDQCLDMRSQIEASYQSGLANNDPLEGVVLIGDLPVPELYHQEFDAIGNPTSLYDNTEEPNDYFYMDIWDQRDNSTYSAAYPGLDVHNMPSILCLQEVNGTNAQGVFPYVWNTNGTVPFKSFVGIEGNQDCFGEYNQYSLYGGNGIGDGILDIWVSRIDAENIFHLRDNAGYSIYDYNIVANYLDRLHARMNYPSLVPLRGFAMGGPSDYPSLESVLGQYMKNLQLPWFVEFTGGENSAFNWMSQLQAGPCGNVNYGAFNGERFPEGNNRRYCVYDQLTDANTGIIHSTTFDYNGWEWAGVYNHGAPTTISFDCPGQIVTLNGVFGMGTLAPFWGQRTGGYVPPDHSNDNGYYYYYNNATVVPDPYNYGTCKGKSAWWRWKVPAGRPSTCDIYLYYKTSYLPDHTNSQFASMHLFLENCDANGVPFDVPINNYRQDTITVDQRFHPRPQDTGPNANWELIFQNVTINANQMVMIELDENTYYYYGPDPNDPSKNIWQSGHEDRNLDFIADAVKFVQSGFPEVVIDNQTPASYHDVNNNPFAILDTAGFNANDFVDRGFEDMQDEAEDHTAVSKTPFFLSQCCLTNWFTKWAKGDNIGNLFALGHSGLICMGTATDNDAGWHYDNFTNVLASGMDFGQAFLAQAQSMFSGSYIHPIYSLLGAGSLRAQSYVQYGSTVYDGGTFNAGTSITQNAPILLTNMTITANGGNVSILSSTTPGWSPLCTHGEVVIRPETHIYPPTAGNTVDIRAITN